MCACTSTGYMMGRGRKGDFYFDDNANIGDMGIRNMEGDHESKAVVLWAE